jgi:hypothetical protein
MAEASSLVVLEFSISSTKINGPTCAAHRVAVRGSRVVPRAALRASQFRFDSFSPPPVHFMDGVSSLVVLRAGMAASVSKCCLSERPLRLESNWCPEQVCIEVNWSSIHNSGEMFTASRNISPRVNCP